MSNAKVKASRGTDVSTGVKKKKNFIQNMIKDFDLWLFVLPGIIITFIYSYMPLYGLQIAFKKFSPKKEFGEANGLDSSILYVSSIAHIFSQH